MTSRRNHRSPARLSGLALVFALAACQEPTNLEPDPTPPILPASNIQVPLDCRVELSSRTMTCDPAPGANPLIPIGIRASVMIGGQNLYVALAAPLTLYDERAEVFVAGVTIRNLLAQALGTSDGLTPDDAGVRVFFHTQPVVTGGSGSVSVRNPDGVGPFTASGQPYFTYREVVPGNATSDPKTWQFNVSPTVTSFSFQLFVQATLRDEKTPISQQPAHVFATSQLSSGANFSCAIRTGSGVYCWGDNRSGQLGEGSKPVSYLPQAIFGPPFTRVTAGVGHSCGLSVSGIAYCWGDNVYGNLGDGTKTSRSTVVAVTMPAGVSFSEIDATHWHTCALSRAGMAFCWGENGNGQLGDGTTIDRLTPTAVSMPPGVTFIALETNHYHTCGLTASGMAYCWGYNLWGQLGDGTGTQRTTPTAVEIPAGVTFVSIAVGQYHTCAVATSGTAYCWGSNAYGQLGDGTQTYRGRPSAVSMPSGESFASVAAGDIHSCAVGPSGVAYCWGHNGKGQLGDGTNSTRLVPTAVAVPSGTPVTRLAAGVEHTCALTRSAQAYCWGYNQFGSIGDGTTVDRSTPTAVMLPAGTSLSQVTSAKSGSCALALSGAAYCWGYFYQGTGAVALTSSPTPILIRSTLEVTSLTAGSDGYHSCGLTSTRTAYCWGSNASGEIGDGTTTPRPAPSAVLTPNGASFGSLAAGYVHTCGLTIAGDAYCWGLNGNGQLGDGTTVRRLAPSAVVTPAGVVFTALGLGDYFTCGLSAAGAAYCWGQNRFGEVGDGTTLQRQTPVAVTMPAGITFRSLATGSYHACGLSVSGAAYCWGANGNGNLGDGSQNNSSTPVAVAMPPGVTFTSITGGVYHTCALAKSGTAYCWGDNTFGALGDGTTLRRLTPTAVQMPNGAVFATLVAGSWHTCAVSTLGKAFCWGANESGQVGDGSRIQRPTPTAVLMP